MYVCGALAQRSPVTGDANKVVLVSDRVWRSSKRPSHPHEADLRASTSPITLGCNNACVQVNCENILSFEPESPRLHETRYVQHTQFGEKQAFWMCPGIVSGATFSSTKRRLIGPARPQPGAPARLKHSPFPWPASAPACSPRASTLNHHQRRDPTSSPAASNTDREAMPLV